MIYICDDDAYVVVKFIKSPTGFWPGTRPNLLRGLNLYFRQQRASKDNALSIYIRSVYDRKNFDWFYKYFLDKTNKNSIDPTCSPL